MNVINSNQNNEENLEKSINLKKIMNNLANSKSVKNKINSLQRFSLIPNYSTIKSHISLFNNKYNNNKQEYRIIKEHFDPKKYIVKEEELFQAGMGYCFGEWALIYNQPRSASVVTLEDSIFFILDEKIFTKTFLKCLNNSEHKKKKFVMDNLFPFDLLNERQSSIYKNIIPITCERNQIVFNEGDKSDTIYLIYLGTFILKRRYKHKNFNVLSLEKGSIVGLESIFEGENSKFHCTLKLTSYDELGLIFSCNVNKLVPYIINKMKELFKNNYLFYLKMSEEFYIKNINIYRKIFFKKKKEKIEEQKDNLNNINDKRYFSVKSFNKNNNKKSFLDNIKNNNSIKFKNSNQKKINSLSILREDNKSKNKGIDRALNRTKTIGFLRLNLNLKEINDKFIRNPAYKRLKTYFNTNSESKNKIFLNNDNTSRSNKDINENYNLEEKKYIESYKEKQFNKASTTNINKILSINNTESISEKIDKYSYPISIFQKSNINEFHNEYLQRESSKNIFRNTIDNSKISFINKIKDDIFQFKERKIKNNKRIEYNQLLTNDNNNQLDTKIMLTKRYETTNLNLSPIKIKKNGKSIQKYINYLLSYENETKLPKNLENISKNKNSNKSDKNKHNKRKIINAFKKEKLKNNRIIKTRNSNVNEINYHEMNEFNSINNSEFSSTKNNLFTFNSGAYKLPLMTQIIEFS